MVVPLALLAGLLSKETAVCTGAYLLAYALFLDRGRPARRLASLLPCLVVGVVWYAFYRGFGFGISGGDVYADPAHDPIGFARQVIQHGPILLLGQWGLPASDVSTLWSASALNVHWWWAVIFLTALGALLVPLIAQGAGAVLGPGDGPFPVARLHPFSDGPAVDVRRAWRDGSAGATVGWFERGGLVVAARRRVEMAGACVRLPLAAVHLLVAPLLFLVTMVVPKYIGDYTNRLLDTFPNYRDDRELEHRTAIVVNSVWGTSRALIQTRHYDGQPFHDRVLDLNSACSPASLRRIDPTTLAVRPQGGYLVPRGWSPPLSQATGDRPPPVVSVVYLVQLLDRLFRNRDNPLELHESVDLTAVWIEITALTDDGRPAEATFHFRDPLDHKSLEWFELTEKGYVGFTPPEIGKTLDVRGFP